MLWPLFWLCQTERLVSLLLPEVLSAVQDSDTRDIVSEQDTQDDVAEQDETSSSTSTDTFTSSESTSIVPSKGAQYKEQCKEFFKDIKEVVTSTVAEFVEDTTMSDVVEILEEKEVFGRLKTVVLDHLRRPT